MVREVEPGFVLAVELVNLPGKRNGKMGLVISYFTAAIVTASIWIVTKKKPLWYRFDDTGRYILEGS